MTHHLFHSENHSEKNWKVITAYYIKTLAIHIEFYNQASYELPFYNDNNFQT